MCDFVNGKVKKGEPGTITSFSRAADGKEVVDIRWDQNSTNQGVFKESWPQKIKVLSKASLHFATFHNAQPEGSR